MLDVSCIIINYNTSKYTFEAVVSLLDTHNNTIKFEIIVVDDGSIDNSIEKINKIFIFKC